MNRGAAPTPLPSSRIPTPDRNCGERCRGASSKRGKHAFSLHNMSRIVGTFQSIDCYQTIVAGSV